VITRVAPSAAAAGGAGLAAGDVVLAIDGRPTAEVLTELEGMTASATPQWRRYRAVEALRLGAEGGETRLAVRHGSGEAATVTLRHTLSYDEPFVEARPEKIAEVRPGIFYVDIDRINDADFKGALDRLAAARGIVFDLRGYPSNLSPVVLAHLIDRPVTSARWDVPVVTRPDGQGVRYDFSNWSVPPEKPRFTAKVAFLIDGRAISYAETYLGIVENYHLAALVGSPTAGTNGNVNPFTLPGGYNVAWTGMQVLKHDGSRHHGVGVHPTVPVERTIAGVAAGRDEILDKGIEVVSP
jgi:C-terminal processing protease CtpA/Prc